jgi:hypothetical protein
LLVGVSCVYIALLHFEICDTNWVFGTCILIRDLPITKNVQTKLMPHLKHMEYIVNVTTHVNLNGEHILVAREG